MYMYMYCMYLYILLMYIILHRTICLDQASSLEGEVELRTSPDSLNEDSFAWTWDLWLTGVTRHAFLGKTNNWRNSDRFPTR